MVDWIERGDVDLVINTPTGTGARADGYEIRRAAVARGVPCITTMAGGMAAARAIARGAARRRPVRSLQEIHGAGDRGGRRVQRGRASSAPAAARSAAERRCTLAPFGRRRAPVTGIERVGAYARRLRWPTPTGPRPTRASSTCSPPPSGGAGERTSGRSCRGRSRCRAAAAAAARLDFLLEDVGPGTRRLAELAPGDERAGSLGPFGRGFAPPRAAAAGAILVGGGVGIAPLAAWADALGRRRSCCSASATRRTPGGRALLAAARGWPPTTARAATAGS